MTEPLSSDRTTIPLEWTPGRHTYAGALRSLAAHTVNCGDDIEEALNRCTPLTIEMLHEIAHTIIEHREGLTS